MLIVHLFVRYAHVNLCHFFLSSWCQGLAATSACCSACISMFTCLMLCLWPGPSLFNYWFPLTLAFSGGLAKNTLSLFRHSDRFEFVFSLRFIDLS